MDTVIFHCNILVPDFFRKLSRSAKFCLCLHRHDLTQNQDRRMDINSHIQGAFDLYTDLRIRCLGKILDPVRIAVINKSNGRARFHLGRKFYFCLRHKRRFQHDPATRDR